MTNPLRDGSQLLMTWAARIEQPSGGLGYPTSSVLFRLMLEGHGAAERLPPGSRVPNVKLNDPIEHVARALEQMPPQWAEAAIARYRLQMKDAEAAQRLGLSVAGFRHRVELCSSYVSGHVSGAVRQRERKDGDHG